MKALAAEFVSVAQLKGTVSHALEEEGDRSSVFYDRLLSTEDDDDNYKEEEANLSPRFPVVALFNYGVS